MSTDRKDFIAKLNILVHIIFQTLLWCDHYYPYAQYTQM